jgi:hypothetical protein
MASLRDSANILTRQLVAIDVKGDSESVQLKRRRVMLAALKALAVKERQAAITYAFAAAFNERYPQYAEFVVFRAPTQNGRHYDAIWKVGEEHPARKAAKAQVVAMYDALTLVKDAGLPGITGFREKGGGGRKHSFNAETVAEKIAMDLRRKYTIGQVRAIVAALKLTK